MVAAVLAATKKGSEGEGYDDAYPCADEVGDGVVAVGWRIGVIGNAGEHDYKRDEVDSDSRPIAANNWGGHALAHPSRTDGVAHDGRHEHEEAQHGHLARKDPGENCGDDEFEERDWGHSDYAGLVERVAVSYTHL